MLIIGIDPGLSGSICFMRDGKILDDLYGISEYQAEWEEQQKNEDAVKVKEFVVDKKKMNMEGA